MLRRQRQNKTFYSIFFLLPFFLTFLSTQKLIAMTEVIDESEVSEVQVAGTYPVRFRTVTDEGVVIEEIRVVTVTEPKTVVSNKYPEAIDAKDFQTPYDILELSESELYMLANVRAWSTYDNSPISVPYYQIHKTGIEDVYRISFSTANGTTTTITGSQTAEWYYTEDVAGAPPSLVNKVPMNKQKPLSKAKVRKKYTNINLSSVGLAGKFSMSPYKQRVVIIGSAFTVTFVFIVIGYFFSNRKMREVTALLYKEEN